MKYKIVFYFLTLLLPANLHSFYEKKIATDTSSDLGYCMRSNGEFVCFGGFFRVTAHVFVKNDTGWSTFQHINNNSAGVPNVVALSQTYLVCTSKKTTVEGGATVYKKDNSAWVIESPFLKNR